MASDLRCIYGGAPLAEAELALSKFAATWDEEHPSIGRSWANNCERICVFFDYALQIRKVIYTTHAIESLNASLRKVTKPRAALIPIGRVGDEGAVPSPAPDSEEMDHAHL